MTTERFLPAAAIPGAGARTITTPFQFLVSGEDHLRVRVWASAATGALVVSGRAADRDGEIRVWNDAIALGGSRLLQTRMIPLAPGYVLSVSAELPEGAVERGQCFVQVDLVRGLSGPLTTLGTLLQGYVASAGGLAYPGSPIVGPLEGPGFYRTLVGTIPAPGAQIAEPGTTNALWALRSFRTTLTTNAVVGARYASLLLQQSSGEVLWLTPSIYPQPASTAINYNWLRNVGATLDAGGFNIATPLPGEHRMNAGAALRTVVVPMAAGDQWSQPTFVVEEWINPWV